MYDRALGGRCGTSPVPSHGRVSRFRRPGRDETVEAREETILAAPRRRPDTLLAHVVVPEGVDAHASRKVHAGARGTEEPNRPPGRQPARGQHLAARPGPVAGREHEVTLGHGVQSSTVTVIL